MSELPIWARAASSPSISKHSSTIPLLLRSVLQRHRGPDRSESSGPDAITFIQSRNSVIQFAGWTQLQDDAYTRTLFEWAEKGPDVFAEHLQATPIADQEEGVHKDPDQPGQCARHMDWTTFKD